MDERGGAGIEVHAWSCSSRTPARNGPGARSDGSQPLMLSSFAGRRRTKRASRLTTIPGFGPIIASGRSLPLSVGRAESFDHGRDLAAWLGLVPRRFFTGGKPKLLGISKRGNKLCANN